MIYSAKIRFSADMAHNSGFFFGTNIVFKAIFSPSDAFSLHEEYKYRTLRHPTIRYLSTYDPSAAFSLGFHENSMPLEFYFHALKIKRHAFGV